jgi:RNA polymerase sigma-70 factor (ECF subfamily)
MGSCSRRISKLLPAAKAGSSRALGQVLEATRRYLLWVARREIDPDLQPKGGPSDLVQETFLEAQRDFGQFTGSSEADLLAWLRRLLLNNLYNFSRRYRETAKRRLAGELSLDSAGPDRESAIDVLDEGRSPGDDLMDREQAEIVERAMARLPEDYRRVIQLWQEEKRTFQEIGLRMGRSPNATRMLWMRAIERLQHELEAMM